MSRGKLQQMTLLLFLLLLLKKIRLDVSCESSAEQRIHMIYQVLFSLKNTEKIFQTVVSCRRDWVHVGLRNIFAPIEANPFR